MDAQMKLVHRIESRRTVEDKNIMYRHGTGEINTQFVTMC